MLQVTIACQFVILHCQNHSRFANSTSPWFWPEFAAWPILEFLPVPACGSPGFIDAPSTLGRDRASGPAPMVPDFPMLCFLRPFVPLDIDCCCCCCCWVPIGVDIVVVVVVLDDRLKVWAGRWWWWWSEPPVSEALPKAESSSWKALSKAFSEINCIQ